MGDGPGHLVGMNDNCEAVVCESGWFEIRDPVRVGQWIAVETPVEVRR